jgi:probable O-glycosylation ligase (exosortase A-associated)
VKSPVNVLMHLFAVWIFMSSIYAYDPDLSKEHYIDFYSWYVIYFLIITIVNTRERFYIFMMVLMLSMAKIAIGTAKQWIMRGFSFTGWGLMGPRGYFQNSGELAILMLVLFPLAYYLYEYLKEDVSRWEKWLLMVFWIASILTILGASSRGAQVALVVQLLVMFYKQIFRFKRLIVIAVLLAGFYYLLPDEQKQRFTEAGEDKTSIQRLLYWEHGMEMIIEHPVLGVGFFNFPSYYEQYYSDDLLYRNAQLPHNIFIQVGTDGGYPALILFAGILFYGVFTSYFIRKTGDECGAVLKGASLGLLGYGVAGQFVSVAYYPFLWIGIAFVVSCVSVIRRTDAKLDVRK